MARIGKLEYDVDADGSLLERRLRNIGNTAGSAGGKATGDSFNREFAATLAKAGDGAFERLRNRMHKLGQETDGTTNIIRRQGAQWGDLSHNTRQWTLIIGAVIAGMQDIAVLGSAAGAGILALGGALTSGVAGLGAFAAVAVTLSKDIDELPPGLRQVKREFTDFSNQLSSTRETIASGAFAEMNGTFTTLASTLRNLTPQMTGIGTAVGKLSDDFARNTEKGTRGYEEISRSLDLAKGNIIKLGGAAGTMGLALLRAFNESQPLVENLLDYVQRLADGFDDFTRSNNFDLWIARSQNVFGSFGDLLDAVGQTLNDLVTPESINRTTEFLDNLAAFMPSLTRLFDIAGRLDVFGLAATALNEFGQALEPLYPALSELASVLSGILAAAIPTLAASLNLVASIIAPLISNLAALAGSLPPGVIEAMTAAVTALAIALGVRSLGSAVAAAVSSMDLFIAKTAVAAGASTSAATKISGALGKAGLIGLAIAGVATLGDYLLDLDKQVKQTDTVIANAIGSNKSFVQTYLDLAEANGQANASLHVTSAALDRVTTGGQNLFTAIGMVGNSFDDVGLQANRITQTFQALDEPLTRLAATDLSAASAQFSGYIDQLGATDSQALNLIKTMPQFEAALRAASQAQGDAGSDADILALALGNLTAQQAIAAYTTRNNADTLANLEGRSVTTGDAITDLADKIRNFGSATLDTREANRQFLDSIDAVTASVLQNGATLDLNTAQGRQNEAALDALAKGALNLSASTLEQTGSQEQANSAIADGRQRLIEALAQFGITGQAAEDYADNLGLIPSNINTAATLSGVSQAESDLNWLARERTAVIRTRAVESAYSGVERPGMASGGILHGPRRILAGEAGPEAIIPLRRSLSQVEPSVRWMSALLQGKTNYAAGGVVGGGSSRSLTVAPNAIQIVGAQDPYRTANAVLNRLAEKVMG